jgi:molecular chaperone DnaJ
MKDYYQILGVGRDASPDDIKRSYRNLAMKYHPDKAGKDASSETKFKEISEAYETLGDPQKKTAYDNPNPFGNSNSFGGGFNEFFKSPGFNFNWGPKKTGFESSNLGRNINARIMISLDEVINGAIKKANVFRRVKCTPCNGTGANNAEMNTCSVCGGSGSTKKVVNTHFGQIAMDESCYNCQGEGRTPKSPCNTCRGEGTQRIQDQVEVRIPKGSVSGMSFVVPGMGDAGKGSSAPGDLVVTAAEIPHDFFKRDNLNLVCHKTISFYQACGGTEIEIPNPKGTGTYKIKVPPGTQSGKVFRLQSKGVPEMGGEFGGDIMVMMDVIVPKNLTPHQLDILKEFEMSIA